MADVISTHGDLVTVVVESSAYPRLPRAMELVGSVAADLAKLGFAHNEIDLLSDGSYPAVLRLLDQWKPVKRPLLFYWTGHAGESGDGLLLLCRDSPNPLVLETTPTALSARRLGVLLASKGLEQTIVFLDACRSGGGAQEILDGFLSKRGELPEDVSKNMEMVVVTSAWAGQVAEEGVFAEALQDVVRDGPAGVSDRQEWFSVKELAHALKAAYNARRVTQLVDHVDGGVGGHPAIFRNPGYRRLPDVQLELRELYDKRIETALEDHFLLKFRGIEVLGDQGWYFCGRHPTLRRFGSWLELRQGGVFVLTGPPGSGKSAVLGRLAVLSDPVARETALAAGALTDLPPDTIPRQGVLTCGLHARGLTMADCLAGFARALETETLTTKGLRDAVAARLRRHEPVVLMLDALDEAQPADILTIATDLLRPLADAGAKVIVGTRQEIPGRVPGAASRTDVVISRLVRPDREGNADADQVWNLADDPDGELDVAEYITKRLLEHPVSPYAEHPREAGDAGRILAARCNKIFLPARVFCHVLTSRNSIPDLTDQESDRIFSRDLSTAFDADLRRFGDREQRIRTMLQPLAWAEGNGLPSREIWPRLVSVLDSPGLDEDSRPPLTVGADGIADLIATAGAYLIESGESGQPVYRLYHEEFIRYLRSGRDPVETQSLIVDALTDLVGSAGRRDWQRANPYLTRHLATHASAAGRLHELFEDPEYLIHADPDNLRLLLDEVDPERQPLARLYIRAVDRMKGLTPAERANLLQSAASRDEPDLLRSLESLSYLVWHGICSIAEPRPFHRVLREHISSRGGVAAVDNASAVTALGHVDLDRPYLAACSDSAVNLWDLATGDRAQTLPALRFSPNAVTIGVLAGAPVLAIGEKGEVRFVDLLTGSPARDRLAFDEPVRALALRSGNGAAALLAVAFENEVRLVQLGESDVHQSLPAGSAHRLAWSGSDRDAFLAVAGPVDVSLWDVARGERVFSAPTPRPAWCLAAAVEAAGPSVACAGVDGSVEVWRNGVRTVLRNHSRPVRCLAFAFDDGRSLLLSGSDDGTARLWNLDDGSSRVLQSTANSVLSAAALVRGGRAILATGDRNCIVRAWDPAPPLTESAADSASRAALASVSAVALGSVGGSAGGAPFVALGAQVGTVQMHDTTSGELLRSWPRAESAVVCLAAEADGLAAGFADGTLVFFDPSGRDEPAARAKAHEGRVEVVCFAPDGRLASGGSDGVVKVWEPAPRRAPVTVGSGRSSIRALAALAVPGGFALAAATRTDIRLWTVPDGPGQPVKLRDVTRTRSEPGVRSLAFGVAGGRTVLAVGDVKGGLQILDLEPDTPARQLSEHGDAVHALAFGRLEDQDVLVSASGDGTVRLWDPVAGRCLDVWAERTQYLRAADFRFGATGLVHAVAVREAVQLSEVRRLPRS